MTRNITRTGRIGKSEISVGRFTYGFENVNIKQWNEGSRLTIGAFCSIAQNVTIFLGGNHRTDWITTFPFGHMYQDELGGSEIRGHPSTNGNVTIGNDVWIGYGATIMSGLNIAHGAVISANAHIVGDVSPYEIVGGNPAKLLRPRFEPEMVELLLRLEWWNLPVEAIKKIQRELSSRPTKDSVIELIKKTTSLT